MASSGNDDMNGFERSRKYLSFLAKSLDDSEAQSNAIARTYDSQMKSMQEKVVSVEKKYNELLAKHTKLCDRFSQFFLESEDLITGSKKRKNAGSLRTIPSAKRARKPTET